MDKVFNALKAIGIFLLGLSAFIAAARYSGWILSDTEKKQLAWATSQFELMQSHQTSTSPSAAANTPIQPEIVQKAVPVQ